ncbi:MAG: acyloxyacyl hydrolase [Acidobacteriota bacterium]
MWSSLVLGVLLATTSVVATTSPAAAMHGLRRAAPPFGVASPPPPSVDAPEPAADRREQPRGSQQPGVAPEQSDGWRRGTTEVAILGGIAKGTVIDPQRTSTHFAQAILRYAFHFAPIGSGKRRGNFSFVVEGVPVFTIDQDPRATGSGVNLLVRYTWAARRFRPMLIAGAGLVVTGNRVPPGETRLNFTPQAGLGFQYMLQPRFAIDIEYRFHHLSNAGRTEGNPGINSHLVLFGVSWFR